MTKEGLWVDIKKVSDERHARHMVTWVQFALTIVILAAVIATHYVVDKINKGINGSRVS